MDLAIDIGNSFSKLAVFDGDKIIKLVAIEKLGVSGLQILFDEFKGIKRSIVSSVKETDTDILDFLGELTQLLYLSNLTPLPFANHYETPETLGRDRIAAVAGAASYHPEKNVLVIDAGTCITYDLLTRNNAYLGGSISPGINMRYQALNTFTGKLPLIKPETSKQTELIGASTEGSIRSGVQKAVLLEVDATIDAYKARFDGLITLVTGGDANYFDKYLKNSIFAAPNLVLVGLKKILDFNEGS
jgi:type III pantothenate kinase